MKKTLLGFISDSVSGKTFRNKCSGHRIQVYGLERSTSKPDYWYISAFDMDGKQNVHLDMNNLYDLEEI